MRRAAMVFGVLALLLLADGAYLELTNNQVGGDQGSFFGNPNVVLSAGTTVLIAGGLLLIVTVVMWLAAARRSPELQARDVSFAYVGAARAALRHVDLAVAAGEVVLVTGASGCGKSTLALTLCGLIPARVHGELRGQVTFAGRPLSGLRPYEASQLVGMVFQNPNQQLINHTVQSEVAFGPENLALSQPEIAARVDWCLRVTGMDGMRKASTVTLSGGQKQRTAIAATLAMRPRVLVLDEPLSDLDPVGAQEVLSTLRRLAAEGTGVVIIEHRVDEVMAWADRVVLMHDGRVVLDRPARGAWEDEAPWRATGVGVPDLVRLAHAVPDLYPASIPLSVEAAADALRDTWFRPALARAIAATGQATAPDRQVPSPGTVPPVLAWEGVSVDFGPNRAVDDVTLTIAEGEWVALVGANGSGKSTLTGLTVGLNTPSRGTVRLRGQPVRRGRIFENAAKVALLLQAADEMLFAETVIGELEFGSRFRARPAAPVLDVAGAVEFFGFRDQQQASPWELSQGGRQRLALAAILVGAPGVLVLDEPTTGQDADHKRAFLRLLDRVRQTTGLTVITVTHDIRTVASRASRVIVLGEGRVRLDGPARSVLARTGELSRWGVLPPPLARLQTALLGPGIEEVLLTVDAVVAAAAAHRDTHAGAGSLS
jgi:energy-coupling factor transporter ATP-binding protein EcfA2